MTGSPRSHILGSLAMALVAILAGCVTIPYQPPAETAHDRSAIANPERLRLSVGPRVFLNEMTKAVSKADPRVKLVDGQTFIDTASPTQELTLAQLSDPATKALTEPLQLDYVILLGEPAEKHIDDMGGMLFALGFFGLEKMKGSTTYWAAVLNAQTLTLVDQLTSESVGTDAGIGLFYGLFVESDTSGSARKDMVRHIVESMASTRPTGPMRVTFLAVEPIATPEQLEMEAQRRDLAMAQWSADRYPLFVAAAPPPEGQALVYLYRPDYGFPELVPMEFQSGSPDSVAAVSRLFSGGYFPFYVPAGKITLGVAMHFKAKLPAPVTLTVDAGSTYYLRGRVGNSFKHGLKLEVVLVDAEMAQPELHNCRLMPSAWDFDLASERRAELGDGIAQNFMGAISAAGVTYPEGQVRTKDYQAAYKWYLISGNSHLRKNVEHSLSPQQIADARRQAAEWRARATKAAQ